MWEEKTDVFQGLQGEWGGDPPARGRIAFDVSGDQTLQGLTRRGVWIEHSV